MKRTITELALKTRHTNKENLVKAVGEYRGPLLKLDGRKNVLISLAAIKGYVWDFFEKTDLEIFDSGCLEHLSQELRVAKFVSGKNGIRKYQSAYMTFEGEEVVLFENTAYFVLFKAHTRISST